MCNPAVCATPVELLGTRPPPHLLTKDGKLIAKARKERDQAERRCEHYAEQLRTSYQELEQVREELAGEPKPKARKALDHTCYV